MCKEVESDRVHAFVVPFKDRGTRFDQIVATMPGFTARLHASA